MTREKIKNTPELVDFMLDECVLAESREKLHKRLEEVCDMAVKVLEQTEVLDKIRAEIEQKCCITVGRENEPAITLYDVFQIIDKYRADKAGEEEECGK